MTVIRGTTCKSLIFFQYLYKEEVSIEAVVYQQWSGDLEGVGCTLATFLNNVVIGPIEYPKPEYKKNAILCNGFDDVVARYIRMHREDKSYHPFYIYPAIAGQKEEYNYYVTYKNDAESISVKVNDSNEMSIDEFLELCAANTGMLGFEWMHLYNYCKYQI